MKRISAFVLFVCLAATGGTLLSGQATSAVFLKGNYIEAGIHRAGSFGTATSAPSDYVLFGNQLGFIADYGRDGWAVGTPGYSGDYFVPGIAVESWGLQWNYGTTTVRRNNAGLLSRSQVTPTSLTDTSSGDTRSAVWEGTASGQIKVTTTMRFGKDDLHIRMDTVLTNTSTAPIASLQFMRNIDPDQEQPWTGNFATRNYVVENGNRKLAVARGRTYGDLTLGLATVDPRAVVTIGGFDNTDPDAAWVRAASVNPLYSESSPHYADEALTLAYRLGDLQPGESVSVSYAYIFNADEFDVVLDELEPVRILTPGSHFIAGTAVPFRATADMAARMDFYAGGLAIGTDTTPDADGVFEVAFDSTIFPDGILHLEAVATFSDGTTMSGYATPSVGATSGALRFVTPAADQVFHGGEDIPVEVGPIPGGAPLSGVTFYRESASSGSVLLGEDTAAPFTSTFRVDGLPPGEVVAIKALAVDSNGNQLVGLVAGNVFIDATSATDVFLKGDYIEAGIHRAGSFGSQRNAPATFTYAHRQLGFIADYGKDGWAIGTPRYAGDYFVPGQPVEGWTLEWTGGDGAERTFTNAGLMAAIDVRPTRLANTSTLEAQSATWEGLATGNAGEQLRVRKTVRFDRDGLYMVMSTVLTNVGSKRLDELEFMRNVDPDQEEPWTGYFSTHNYATEDGDRKLAVARARTYPALTLGLGTIDSRAMVTMGGFDNRDPDWVWSRAADINHLYSESRPRYADEALALAYRLGSLEPGKSVAFDYAYVLNADDLDEALEKTAAVTILQPSGTVSGNGVAFKATPGDALNVTKMAFYVDGELVGEDLTPDADGVFETTFDTLSRPNVTIPLKAVVSFADGRTAERNETVTIANPGPPIAFAAPLPGQVFYAGVTSTANVIILDSAHPPVRVDFYRESASSGSLLLVEDTAAPFEAAFDVTDLPEGETVSIKAVGFDDLNRMTNIEVAGTVKVAQPQTITFEPLSPRTYGDADFTIVATSDSGLPVSLSATGNCSVTGNIIGVTGAGSCTVTASQAGDEDYEPAPDVAHTFEIARATLMITANSVSRVYGNENPALTASYTGFVRGDTAAVLAGEPALSTAATPASHIGSYAVTAAGGTLSAANYAFTFVNGTLSVTPRELTVAARPASKTYGDADPALLFDVSAGSLATGDGFSGALARVPGESVGAYAIGQGTLTLGANYALSYVGANLVVTSRALTVAADPGSKLVGAIDPPLTYSITAGALVAGDALGGMLTREPGEAAGTYAILQGTLTAGLNYAMSYRPAAFTIQYGTCLLYDTGKANAGGSAIPIKLQVCDADGRNVGSPELELQVVGAFHAVSNAPIGFGDAGQANPGGRFRVTGPATSYVFNLKTDRGTPAGDYYLAFTIGSDPAIYRAPFRIGVSRAR